MSVSGIILLNIVIFYFFNTLACLPKSSHESASRDMEVLFFSATLFCKKMS